MKIVQLFRKAYLSNDNIDNWTLLQEITDVLKKASPVKK
jgi:hypothetical protein